MKKLALAFFVILGLASVAWGTQRIDRSSNLKIQQSDQLVMPLAAVCVATDIAEASLLLEYGESPFAQGEAVVWNTRLQEYIEVLAKIYLNPKDFSFTIAYEVPTDKVTCIMATGKGFQPAYKGPKL